MKYPKDHCLHSWQWPGGLFSQVSSLWGGWPGANSQGWCILGAWQEATGPLFPFSFSLCSGKSFPLRPLQSPPHHPAPLQWREGATWELVPSPSPESHLPLLWAGTSQSKRRQQADRGEPCCPVLRLTLSGSQGPGPRPSGPLRTAGIVQLLGKLRALLEAFRIQLPVINRHWLGFKDDSSRPKVPEKI